VTAEKGDCRKGQVRQDGRGSIMGSGPEVAGWIDESRKTRFPSTSDCRLQCALGRSFKTLPCCV
jgi:hypothetical protein